MGTFAALLHINSFLVCVNLIVCENFGLIVLPESSVQLSCEGTGSPPSSCRWRSPTGCCYGDQCVMDSNQTNCRTSEEWSIAVEDDTCVLTLDNVTSADSGGQDTWTCDQGQGEVTVYLTVASQGNLMWSSVPGIQNTNAKFEIGEEVRLTCSAKNSIPEGVFVWRIGDKTLKNLQPLELSIDEDGSSVVSQDLVLVGNTMLGGQIVFCYHLQLDHTGDVINTMFIERKMQLIEDSGISQTSMKPKDYSDIDNEMIDSNEAVEASDSTFMSGKIDGENSIETTMTIIEDTISTEINAKMTPTPELPSFLNGTTRKIPDSDEASNSTLISKEFSDEDSIVSTVDSSTIRTIAKSEANTEFTTTRKVQKSFSPDTTTSLASTSDANFDTTFGTTISEDEEYISNEIDADVFDKKTTDPEIVFDSNKIETVKNIDIEEKETVTENISTTRPRTDNEVSISNKINGDGKSPKSSSTSERSMARTTIQNSQTSDSSKDQLQSDLDNDLITFPNMDNKENCHEIKQDIFISWGKGRLMNTPDFIKFKSFVQCKNECQARADCLAWNFSPYFGCNLKASALNEIQFSGWLSGTKFC